MMLINESVTIPSDKAVASRLQRRIQRLNKLISKEKDALRKKIMQAQAAVLQKYLDKVQEDPFDLGQFYDDIIEATLEVIGNNDTMRRYYLGNFMRNYNIAKKLLGQ